MRLVSLLLEEFHGLLEGHFAGVHPDADQVAGIAQQRVLELSEAQLEKGGVILLGEARGAAVAFIEHHLLGVVGPALSVRGASEQLAHLVGRPLHPEELHVVAGVRLVDRGADHRAPVEAGHVLLDLLRRPGLLGQGDVEERLLRFLERSRRVHRGKRERAHERRRLLHDGQHGRGDGDDPAGVDEAAQVAEGVAE